MWNSTSGKEIRRFDGHDFIVSTARLLPNGLIVSASEDGEVKFWSAATGSEIGNVKADCRWKDIDTTPDQSVLFGIGDDGSGHFVSITERRYIGRLSDVTSSITSFCFRENDGCLALRCADDTIWIVPLGPIQMCSDSRKLAVAVALARDGVGVTTPYERQHDVLLAEAPKTCTRLLSSCWPDLIADVDIASASSWWQAD